VRRPQIAAAPRRLLHTAPGKHASTTAMRPAGRNAADVPFAVKRTAKTRASGKKQMTRSHENH